MFIESVDTNPNKQIQSSSTYDISGMFDIHVSTVISIILETSDTFTLYIHVLSLL